MISRKLKRGEIRHAQVRSDKGGRRLIAYLTPDGWLAGVYEMGGADWEFQGQWPDPEGAVAQLEFYARQVLKVSGRIEWSSDPP